MSVDIVKLFQESTRLTLPMLAMYKDCVYPSSGEALKDLRSHITKVFFCNSLNERDAFMFESSLQQLESPATFVVKLTGFFETEEDEGHFGFVVEKIGDYAAIASEKPMFPISIKLTDKRHMAIRSYRFAKVLLGEEKAYAQEDYSENDDAVDTAFELLLKNGSFSVEMTFTAWGRILGFVVS